MLVATLLVLGAAESGAMQALLGMRARGVGYLEQRGIEPKAFFEKVGCDQCERLLDGYDRRLGMHDSSGCAVHSDEATCTKCKNDGLSCKWDGTACMDSDCTDLTTSEACAGAPGSMFCKWTEGEAMPCMPDTAAMAAAMGAALGGGGGAPGGGSKACTKMMSSMMTASATCPEMAAMSGGMGGGRLLAMHEGGGAGCASMNAAPPSFTDCPNCEEPVCGMMTDMNKCMEDKAPNADDEKAMYGADAACLAAKPADQGMSMPDKASLEALCPGSTGDDGADSSSPAVLAALAAALLS